MPTGVEPDTADSIVNSVVVPMSPIHFQSVPVGYSCWVIIAWFLHAYPERIFGVKIEDPVVFNIDLRNPVISCGE